MDTFEKNKFIRLLADTSIPLLGDGAMGTVLNAYSIDFGQCFDALNLTHPTLVAETHRAYIEAGARIIQTNTFGANSYKLGLRGLERQVVDINRAGVELAQQARGDTFREILIAGDVGPLGVRLAPYGRVQPEDAETAFAEQIQALVASGVDLLILETFSDLHELIAAVRAARQVGDVPVVASMTYTRDDLTLLGDSPTKVARVLAENNVDVIGANCSGGPAQIWRILRQMHDAVPSARFSVMPNAGWPEQVGGRIMYPANTDYFGEYALAFCEAGASMVGGCCGTTPEHIAAMRFALENISESCAPSVVELSMPAELDSEQASLDHRSRLSHKLAAQNFVVSVEMDPPRGLSAHKLLAGASLLAESGADVINVADSPMARMRMSPWAVCDLVQRKVNIETTLHFPTRGRNLLRVQGDLLAAHALGIRNVFVVMGDPTSIGDYPDAMDNYDLVPSGLIKLIKQSFNIGIDHAGADIGQPTSFFVGCALNLTPAQPDREIKNLRRKLEAGADFVLTQPIYDPNLAIKFLQQYGEQHGSLDVPVLVGVLPLFSARHAAFLHHEVPGIHIPAEIQARMASALAQAPQTGVQIALELIEQIKPFASGIYLMPQFGRYDLAAEVVENCR